MRQAGVLAAAGIVALTGQMERLAEDHANAALLASGLAEIEGVKVDQEGMQTNMVFVRIGKETAGELTAFLKERGILATGRDGLRLVTHLDVTETDIGRTVAEVKGFFRKG